MINPHHGARATPEPVKNFMIDTDDINNIKRYIKETWNARIKVPFDKDFIEEFEFSEYVQELKKKDE